MHTLPPLIFDLAVMLGLASIINLFFQKIRQPVVLGYLLAGIIIGPYTPPHILVNDIPNIKILSELGVVFLIFSLGLEFSFQKLVRVGFSASITGLLEVIFMTFLGFELGIMLGWTFNNALFLGAALSISSTTIIIKAIEELDLLKKHFSELIFGILIIEDLLAILLLVILSAVVISQDVFSINMLWVTTKLVLVVGGWFIAGYFFIPTLHRAIKPYATDESMTILAVSLCLILVSLAGYLQYSIALGAFVMGSILAETHAIHKIRIQIRPIRDIFAAVFFIATGMLMNPKVVIAEWPLILLITVVTILGKILSSGMAALLSGQSIGTALRVGFGMAQIGEFSFIIVGLGVTLNAVDESLFPIIVAVSIITTFTTPYCIRLSGYVVKVLEHKLSEKQKNKLKNYSLMINKAIAVIAHKGSNIAGRLIVNAMVVAILFTLSHQSLLPLIKVSKNIQPWVSIIIWFLVFIVASPFVWGLCFATHPIKDKHDHRPRAKLSLLSLIVAIIEMAIIGFLFFKNGLFTILSLFIITLYLILFHSRLEKIYFWFEQKLKKNIGSADKNKEDLSPWDL